MLFNSYPFIFCFLPVTLVCFFLIARKSYFLASGWLTLASLAFYGWWNPRYLALLLLSIVFNFVAGMRIASFHAQAKNAARLWFVFAVTVDLALLAYYKYTGFLISNWNALTSAQVSLPEIALPLGISFFTFTQIAFLADAYQGLVREQRPMHYALFVTWFPHLLAGPVLHHKEMMPQFGKSKTYQLDWRNLAVGFTMFFLGLVKKVGIADRIAEYVHAPFAAAAIGKAVPLLDAWGGALAYTFQLYFDFSGYSDMAIGLSLLFGVKLPLNFNSPYKATSIIDFWRRWHMTLSRFLRDYLYIPLGGNRRGTGRRYFNLTITMILGGLWHGASWTFVIWGGLHGVCLLFNHAWRNFSLRGNLSAIVPVSIRHLISLLLTFSIIVLGWVLFRANNLTAVKMMLEGMAGLQGIVMPYAWLENFGDVGKWLALQGVEFRYSASFGGNRQVFRIVLCLLIVWIAPNSQQIMGRFQPALGMPVVPISTKHWWLWQPTTIWMIVMILIATIAILWLTEVSEFIYFQF